MKINQVPKPSALTVRAAVDENIAQQVWLKVLHEEGEQPPMPWAAETEMLGQRWVVGQAVPEYFTVLPLPFSGHSDDWEVIKPINTADDLLKQLKGE